MFKPNLPPRWTARNGKKVSKTQRDRSSGAHSRCIANKQARADWQNDKNRSMSNFPWYTCNGKRNRRPSKSN